MTNISASLDRLNADIVLIVDDVPENLSLLHDALDEAGYTVLVATSGESALQRARHSLPDMILLDALMPVMDGFEVARRLKADHSTRHIPIVFMTGLTETQHVVDAFSAGGVDYVTKPIRPAEVLARISAHMENARQIKQARRALDAVGQATLSIRAEDGHLVWQTVLAQKLLGEYFPPPASEVPSQLIAWVRESEQSKHARPGAPLAIRGTRRLLASLHAQPDHGGEWLIALSEEDDDADIECLIGAFRLTRREGEVLYWVTRGKTSKDIGDILGASSRTVDKHLEHVFEKLGVETRTAAANLAITRVRNLDRG